MRLWVAHASRVLVFGVAPKQPFDAFAIRRGFCAFRKVCNGEDANASTGDGCATQHIRADLNAGGELASFFREFPP